MTVLGELPRQALWAAIHIGRGIQLRDARAPGQELATARLPRFHGLHSSFVASHVLWSCSPAVAVAAAAGVLQLVCQGQLPMKRRQMPAGHVLFGSARSQPDVQPVCHRCVHHGWCCLGQSGCSFWWLRCVLRLAVQLELDLPRSAAGAGAGAGAVAVLVLLTPTMF